MPATINRSIRNEFLLGAALVVAGLMISGMALSTIQREQRHTLAQAVSTPSTNVDQPTVTDAAGPKDPAPQPARPSNGTTGAAPSGSPAQKGDALPSAPPEKIGAPISPGSSTK